MKARNIEMQGPEEFFKKLAIEEALDKSNPNADEIQRLNIEYNSVMADYDTALDTNDEAAEAILQKANAIIKKIIELDPKLKKASLEQQAADLNRDLNLPKQILH